MTNTISQFLDACQPFGYPLLACSILLLTVILYHLIFVGRAWRKTIEQLQFAHSRHLGDHGDAFTSLREHCLQHHNDLSQAALTLLDSPASSSDEKLIEARLTNIIDSGRSGMATINIITNIAPMLGILGTAWGLVDIFGVFGAPDAQAGIAIGISKALYTTIFGLAIAVPGIIANIYFERRLETRAARISECFIALLHDRRQA